MKPFLVGDAAFPLAPTMLNVYDSPSPAQADAFRAAGKARFNRSVINSQREIERAFGRLKGRWAFCRRNTFFRDPIFIRKAIRVCCSLHNFVERLGVTYDEEWASENPGAVPDNVVQGPAPPAAPGQDGAGRAAAGRQLRDFMSPYLLTNDIGQ